MDIIRPFQLQHLLEHHGYFGIQRGILQQMHKEIRTFRNRLQYNQTQRKFRRYNKCQRHRSTRRSYRE